MKFSKIDNAEDSEETVSGEVNETGDGELENDISVVLPFTRKPPPFTFTF